MIPPDRLRVGGGVQIYGLGAVQRTIRKNNSPWFFPESHAVPKDEPVLGDGSRRQGPDWRFLKETTEGRVAAVEVVVTLADAVVMEDGHDDVTGKDTIGVVALETTTGMESALAGLGWKASLGAGSGCASSRTSSSNVSAPCSKKRPGSVAAMPWS